jgi:hypothetical protein
MPNAVNVRLLSSLFLAVSLLIVSGCFARESWTRSELFARGEVAKSTQTVDATIESVAFLGGMQRGLNLDLDKTVTTDQGPTKRIYLEQPVQLPTGIVMMRRVRVHFDAVGSPLFIERIEPARAP